MDFRTTVLQAKRGRPLYLVLVWTVWVWIPLLTRRAHELVYVLVQAGPELISGSEVLLWERRKAQLRGAARARILYLV